MTPAVTTPPLGFADRLRVQLSPEAEIFLGSLHESSGEILLLLDRSAPEERRLRWVCPHRDGYPRAYLPWARISCGTLLIRRKDLPAVRGARLFVDLVEDSPGSARSPCPILRLSVRFHPLSADDLVLRQLFDAPLEAPSPLPPRRKKSRSNART